MAGDSKLSEALRGIWTDGYDQGRRDGVRALVAAYRQVVVANGGEGLSAEAAEIVFSAVLTEVGVPTDVREQGG